MTDKTKPDDPAQSQRFIDMACEVEVDESPEAFDQAFEKVVPSRTKVVSKDVPGGSGG